MTQALEPGLHLHFDPESGIAGDMTVAALVHAGVPESVVIDAVATLQVPGLLTRFESRQRGAFAGKGFVVTWPGSADGSTKWGRTKGFGVLKTGESADHVHRDHAEIRRMLAAAPLPPGARKLAEDIFARIAQVEASLHGVSPDEVGFHEVGAYDSIADVVGVAAALDYLRPCAVTSTPPVLGTGQVRTAHGTVPIPAPATAALLLGKPVRSEGQGELTTPTGAAVLSMIVGTYGPPPPWTLVAQGFGAGTKDFPDRSNVLRVMLGRPLAAANPERDGIELVETNLDDMNPQLVAPLCEKLFAAGAVDVWSTPIQMKKGRPGLTVSALCPAAALDAIAAALFQHSTTIGLRHSTWNRRVLARVTQTVTTPWGEVNIKISSFRGQPTTATPEFEDCRKLATAAGVPVRQVVEAAQAAATLWLAAHRQGSTAR